MSVIKLMNRIVQGEGGSMSHKHAYTYGITSDAMAQFAVAFCALIHGTKVYNVVNSDATVKRS